jgi:hypothetical protein
MSARYLEPLTVVKSSGRPLAEVMAFAEIVDGKPMIGSARAEMIINSALGALQDELASPPPALARSEEERVRHMVMRQNPDCTLMVEVAS